VTVHARRIASVPKRSASETWRAISDLLAEPGTEARRVLDQALGLASMLIAEEYTRGDAITVTGAGPQLRVYTLHGMNAIEADAEEDPFAFVPTSGDWKVSFPCGDADLDAAQEIAAQLQRVEVRGIGVDLDKATSTKSRIRPVIDIAELERS
jgi:hypothetical protein